VALSITIAANDNLLVGAILGRMTSLTTVEASSTTTTLGTITGEVTNWSKSMKAL
jgi:hypothetical protein